MSSPPCPVVTGRQMKCDETRFVLMHHTFEWLWIYIHMDGHLTKMYRLDQLPNLKIFSKPFFSFSKCSQLVLSANEIHDALSSHLFGWFCSDYCSGNGSPFEQSSPCQIGLPSGICSHIQLGHFFNPLMQNKMCM